MLLAWDPSTASSQMLAAQQTLVELPEASNSDNAPTKPAVVLPPALTDEAAAARANVCYEARQSAIEGLGVFATELIPAGHVR